MRYKTTARAIREGYDKIISIGLAKAQYLLKYQDADAYNCGIYGRNFDLYDINGVAICMGGRNMPRGIAYDHERLRFFEEKAERVCIDLSVPYERRVAIVNELLRDFIGEVLGKQGRPKAALFNAARDCRG